VGEDSVSLFGNPNFCEFARQIGKIRDLDAGDVVEIAGIVAVAADAVGDLPDPSGNVRLGLLKPAPLARNGGAAFPSVTLADTG
jgi:hypothetical protein